MFKKSFKVKSNTQIKTSERKQLKDLLLKKFPILTEADLNTLLGKKEVAYCSKILTATDKHVLVYSIQKRPLFFSVDDIYFPTVYLLWQYPKIGITFTTNSFVLSKIMQGADLMLPGVFNAPAKDNNFLGKQVAVVNSLENRAPIAVGLTLMSSVEMNRNSMGKCVAIYHFAGDKLCTMDDISMLPIPQLGPAEGAEFEIESNCEFPPLCPNNDNNEGVVELENDEGEPENAEEFSEETEVVDEIKDTDDLLIQCFLTAIKYSKTLELPILMSNFYKLQMLPNCPEGNVLDIKKSSYKKVGQFLRSMEKEGLITIKEKKKGVETIEAINREHQKYVEFYVELDNRPKKPENNSVDDQSRNIVESYIVTQAVLPIFKESGINKGATVQPTDIRKYVTNYVKTHNCQDEANKRFVKVQDPILRNICKNEVSVTWEDLMDKVTSSMKSCFKITAGDAEITNKGKIQPIVMSTQTRSGNKKVTIVDNLELYNIKMSEFAKECQHGVAASTSVNRPPGKKSDQILIQGNQVLFVFNLLTEKYKIPKKYIRGLEHAPKAKK